MTTFDGSTTPASETFPTASTARHGLQYETTPEPAFDAFESLREQIAERDEETERTTAVEVPGIGWRLVCAIDFGYPQYKEWQKAALPKSQRNGRKVNVLDMDQAMLGYFVLLNTCEGIEYRRGDTGEWELLTEDGGQPATLESGMLLSKMGVMDPRLLVKRMFGGDAKLILAGNKVVTAAGYGEQEDEADPTDPTP